MIRNIFLLVLTALAAWSCTATDDETAQGPATATRPADAQHSLRITIAPKPAFTEAAITMPDGKNRTNTRAVQTEQGTEWEEGDVVWLCAFFQDLLKGDVLPSSSALKYTDAAWRYLTEAEAGEMGLNDDPKFNRTLIYDKYEYNVQDIWAYYVGNGKPDTNGLITIPAPGSDASVPVMEAYGKYSNQGDSWSVSFTYCCSRLRIPAGYGLQMTNYGYHASYLVRDGKLFSPTYATGLQQLPAADRDRDIFLLPVADALGTPARITLTRNGSAVCTFTPQSASDFTGYYGLSYTLSEIGSGSVTPGGM